MIFFNSQCCALRPSSSCFDAFFTENNNHANKWCRQLRKCWMDEWQSGLTQTPLARFVLKMLPLNLCFLQFPSWAEPWRTVKPAATLVTGLRTDALLIGIIRDLRQSYQKTLVVNHDWRMGNDCLWLFWPLRRSLQLLWPALLACHGFGTP